VARKVALNRRDIAILNLLTERRVETLDYLHETIFPGLSRKRALNRLGDLARDGYLERLDVSLLQGDGRPESVYRLGPRAKTALELRSAVGAEAFRGRRFNPVLRGSSIDHQIMTTRVADWIGAQLTPEHLLPAGGRGDAFRHRPDGTYTSAQPDSQGRQVVFLEVDLGHYSRERLLGKVKAFLNHPQASAMLIAVPTRQRVRQIASWIGEAYPHSNQLGGRVVPLTFDQIRAGALVSSKLEPAACAEEVDDAT
jgi:hypothetical protein